MAKEDKKDFNAMLADSRDMPKIQIVTDERTIQKYGGNRMYFAPPAAYDEVMKKSSFRKGYYCRWHQRILCAFKRCRFHRSNYSRYICINCRMGKLPERYGQDSILENSQGGRRA